MLCTSKYVWAHKTSYLFDWIGYILEAFMLNERSDNLYDSGGEPWHNSISTNE